MLSAPLSSLLVFVDRLSLDEKLYWRVPVAESAVEVEILWTRAKLPASWTIKGAGAERTVDTVGMAALLAELRIDGAAFERQLGVTVLTQACFADLVRRSAVELFGEKAVEKSIADTKAFLDQVGETAAKLAKAPTLRVVR